MGRRPNAIVQEFFHRGQKLSDNSNRYVHTCRRCGDVFPKGRVDGLMSHLLRRCPNVSQEDRHYVFQSIQQQNPKAPRAVNNADTQQQQQQQQQQQPQPQPLPATTSFPLQADLSLPFLLQRDQSALDTLAEVSRRHLDYSSKRQGNGDVPEQSFGDAGRRLAEQELLADLQGKNGISPYTPSMASEMPGFYSLDGDHGLPQTQHSLDSVIKSGFAHSPLVQTASAANRELEQVAEANEIGTLDPQLEDLRSHVEMDKNISKADDEADAMAWELTTGSDTHTFGNTPSNDITSGFSLISRANKTKARGRFSDTRRKEVQEIRKRGACIRCRMLKKPCSEGTPCSTCRNVESARLWKSSCLRTRLADQFTLWSTGFFHAKTNVEIPAAVHGLEQSFMTGRVEARLFPKSDASMSFAARQYHRSRPPGRGIDPNLHDQRNSGDISTASNIESNWNTDSAKIEGRRGDSAIFLLDEGEGVPVKIREYLSVITDTFIDEESSDFLRSTLQLAQYLMQAQDDGDFGSSNNSATRSCYNLQKQLLNNVVELWVECSILTQFRKENLELHYHESSQRGEQPGIVQFSTDGEDAIHPEQFSTRNRELVFVQLLAAIESHCASLGKNVLNELEKRLLRRQQVSGFATFISAVILLNCVERMTGFYRAFDPLPSSVSEQMSNDVSDPNQGDTAEDALASAIGQQPAGWLLDESPRKLWRQGEDFAEILIMLLRMRALPPLTVVTAEGTLVVDQDHSLQSSVSGKSVNEQVDQKTKMAASWLDPLLLDAGQLVKKRRHEPPEHDESVTSWDLKFISLAILPENMK